MKQKALRDALQSMAAMPGLEGCALVEIEAGMVWHHAGQIEGVQTFAEAASDYWRLYNRLADQCKQLLYKKTSVITHAHGLITRIPSRTPFHSERPRFAWRGPFRSLPRGNF